MKFHVHNPDASVAAYRMQFPVIYAYGIAVHRRHGLTLLSVRIDFSSIRGCIQKGIVYVALSRCSLLDGLWISGLSSEHIQVIRHVTELEENVRRLRKHYQNRLNCTFVGRMHMCSLTWFAWMNIPTSCPTPIGNWRPQKNFERKSSALKFCLVIRTFSFEALCDKKCWNYTLNNSIDDTNE